MTQEALVVGCWNVNELQAASLQNQHEIATFFEPLRDSAPDVLALQEVPFHAGAPHGALVESLDAFGLRLAGSSELSPAHHRGGTTGLATFCRPSSARSLATTAEPVTAPKRDFSEPPAYAKGMLCTRFSVPDMGFFEFDLVNVHLYPLEYLCIEDSPSHDPYWEDITNAIGRTAPSPDSRIVIGDFNVRSAFRKQWIAGRMGLRPVFGSLTTARYGGSPDDVLVPTHWTTRSSRRIHGLSDHYFLELTAGVST